MPHGGPHGAGFSRPSKAPTRAEIERTYDQALDRFIRQNQDKKQQQSSVKSVVADMPQKFQDFIARNTKDGRMNEAAKAIFRQYDDGRSQYSRDMNRMVQKSPEFAAARARRFPIETFIERMTPAAVGLLTGTPLGLGTLYDESRKLGSAAIGGLKEIAMKKGIIPRDDINPQTLTTSVKTDVINPAATSRAEDQSLMPDIDFLSPQDMGFDAPLGRFVPNPQDMNITAQPGRFVPNPQDMNIQPKMTARDYFDDLSQAEKEFVLGLRQDNPAGMLQTDPNMFINPATGRPIVFAPIPSEVDQLRGNIPGIGSTTKMTRNMFEQLDPFINPDVPFVPLRDGGLASLNNFNLPSNEGGLASINNPQYNMLMKASDFDI